MELKYLPMKRNIFLLKKGYTKKFNNNKEFFKRDARHFTKKYFSVYFLFLFNIQNDIFIVN